MVQLSCKVTSAHVLLMRNLYEPCTRLVSDLRVHTVLLIVSMCSLVLRLASRQSSLAMMPTKFLDYFSTFKHNSYLEHVKLTENLNRHAKSTCYHYIAMVVLNSRISTNQFDVLPSEKAGAIIS